MNNYLYNQVLIRLVERMLNKNYQFFMKINIDQFIGEWVAICDQKIISHGKSPKDVLNEAKLKCPNERPFMIRVPDKETMIFVFQ